MESNQESNQEPNQETNRESNQPRGSIVSASPGRVRLRIHREHRDPKLAQQIQQSVASRPGITRVDVNHRTGSVAVCYDHHLVSPEGLLEIIHDVGVVVVEAMGETPELESLEGHPTRSSVASNISTSIDRLDKRLAQATGRTVDLRLLFPIGLFALGVRQVFVDGFGLTQVPGYVLLWYAFDAFWKLHRELPDHPGTRGHAPRHAAIVAESVDLSEAPRA